MKRLIAIVVIASAISGVIFYFAADAVRQYINAIYGTPPSSHTLVTPLVKAGKSCCGSQVCAEQHHHGA